MSLGHTSKLLTVVSYWTLYAVSYFIITPNERKLRLLNYNNIFMNLDLPNKDSTSSPRVSLKKNGQLSQNG